MNTGEFAEIPTNIYEPYEVLEVSEVAEVRDVWQAEPETRVFNADGSLAGDEKVVIGYLTLEEQGWFDGMTPEEQVIALANLRGS